MLPIFKRRRLPCPQKQCLDGLDDFVIFSSEINREGNLTLLVKENHTMRFALHEGNGSKRDGPDGVELQMSTHHSVLMKDVVVTLGALTRRKLRFDFKNVAAVLNEKRSALPLCETLPHLIKAFRHVTRYERTHVAPEKLCGRKRHQIKASSNRLKRSRKRRGKQFLNHSLLFFGCGAIFNRHCFIPSKM